MCSSRAPRKAGVEKRSGFFRRSGAELVPDTSSGALEKHRSEADYISVSFDGPRCVSLMRMCLELVIVGASESRAFLRCNLLCPDERPSHNGPSPAYEASMEQVCSLEGDYNGFTTDLAHSFATPPHPHPPATFTFQKRRSGARCSRLSPALL